MTTKITEQNISELANAGVNWQSVFTGDGSTGLTAVAGRGYFIDTTSGTVTVTLPASPSAGDVVVLKDYARTWVTNNVSIASNTFDGNSKTLSFSTSGQTVTLVYMDGTKGWSLINEDTTTDLSVSFISATGGTVTTSGDYKIHTFTGDGCFVVSSLGSPGVSTIYRDKVSYLVVAGGGSGGARNPGNNNGGGGGGGFREGGSESGGCYSASPLNNTPGALTVTATTYPITVGGGGASVCQTPSNQVGNDGSNSVFSTITSAGGGGGGGGGNDIPLTNGQPGGSGGGSGGGIPSGVTGGTGNTPPTSPPQGNNGGIGGTGSPNQAAAGGGGATEAGQNEQTPASGRGGAGATTSISGSSVGYSGGGGGSSGFTPGGAGSPCGSGAAGSTGPVGNDATANQGGGGGGGYAGGGTAGTSGAGGKGIVIIRYKYK